MKKLSKDRRYIKMKQENIPDKIQASGKKLPFAVPDSYFENLPGIIQGRLPGSRKPFFTSMVRAVRPQLALAAMFIGLIAVGYAGFRILSNNGNGLGGDELVEAIEYFGYDFDDEMLISAIIESDIDLSPGPFETQTDEIIQYLSEDEIDFSGLLNDF